jgi:NAD-dependent SIR2 family protein deacetylase
MRRLMVGEVGPNPGHLAPAEIEQRVPTGAVFLSIGTSGMVQPTASPPFPAKQDGAVWVEINIEETPLTRSQTIIFRENQGKSCQKWSNWFGKDHKNDQDPSERLELSMWLPVI